MENKFKPNASAHPLRIILYTIFLSTAIISTFILLAHKEILPFLAPVQNLIIYQICPGAHDHTSGATIPVPPASEFHPKIFEPIPALEAAIGDPEDVDWDEYLLTPNGGFIMVDEGDGVTKGYGVTMFHQLHCLGMIRTMLFGGSMNHDHEVQGAEWSKNPLHFLHCLDYIAQVSNFSSLVCARKHRCANFILPIRELSVRPMIPLKFLSPRLTPWAKWWMGLMVWATSINAATRVL